ncbi:hypothetical protein [Acinetobacter nosocomialis]|uniref:hypothetical protein n=1 Tax=Acinetobacter nosocomialis TaxID=106654 RepID=UPI001F3109DB|nr:hypothetical protein [Acinetobacter nosocomialis]MCE5997404.1 hypothetical protein [Acinetobacter nosocomialis]MCH2007470.1 hypothetical protein [Acinetobacter nosocomialis]
MGNPSLFLVDRVGKNLEEAIDLLAQVSNEFKSHWQRRYMDGCNQTSEIAVKNFDFIVNEILRLRDDLPDDSEDQYSKEFKNLLKLKVGKIAFDITYKELVIFNTSHRGYAKIDEEKETQQISLGRLLNKIKHRCISQINFRFDQGEHILVIGSDAFGKDPNCIVEFSVKKFCSECQKISNLIKSNSI